MAGWSRGAALTGKLPSGNEKEEVTTNDTGHNEGVDNRADGGPAPVISASTERPEPGKHSAFGGNHGPRGARERWVLPLLCAVAAVLGFLSFGALTGALLYGPSEAVSAQFALMLLSGQGTSPWSLLTSGLLARSWPEYLLNSTLLFIAVAFAVRFAGVWRTVLGFVLGTVGSSLALLLILDWGISGDNDLLNYVGNGYLMGVYGGVSAVLGLTTAAFEPLWRRRLRLWLVAAAMMLVLYLGHGEAILALLGALTGIGLGVLLLRHGTGLLVGPALRHSSLRETRVLVATVLAVFALGLVLSQLTANFAVGPLAAATLVLLQSFPDSTEVGYICGGDQACIALQNAVGIASPGAVVLSLIPVLLLLVCADGLRRGRRLSWWITVMAQGYMAAVSLLNVLLLYAEPQAGLSFSSGIAFYLLPTVLVPAMIVGVLIATRGAFTVRSEPAASRSLARTALLSALSLLLLYLIAWFAEGNLSAGPQVDPFARLGQLLTQLPHLLIPFQLPFEELVLPQGVLSTLLYTVGGAVLWLIFLVLLVQDWRRYGGTARDRSGDRARAAALVRTGGGPLSPMALWNGNFYWFTPDGRAGVAYQVHQGVALTIAEPFGEPAQRGEAARQFTGYAVEMGLIPCFYSAPAELGTELARLGFHSLEVAQETRLRVRDQNFKGKEWQNVRTAMNKARKLEVTEHWGTYASFAPGLRAQIIQLSEQWVAEKALPQLGFTLGGPDELKDDSVMCCLAVSNSGTVLAATSWLPVYRDGQIISWTLDFMRRRPDAFNGVMEFLIASAVKHFQNQVTEISLSGSPLVRAEISTEEQNQDAMSRLLAFLADALEPFYGFRSLAAFKSRFKPVYRTLYMYYQDQLALPSIAFAVAEAYLPSLSARQRAALLGSLLRGNERGN